MKAIGRYRAIDIARYAVNRRYVENKPISNLQLQKILYFLQVIHASQNNELLFPDEFEAWPYGPVVPGVYSEFADCGGYPIKRGFDIEIDEPVRSFLDAGVDTLAEKSPWDLVRISHAKGSPWDAVYNEGAGYKEPIPNDAIMEFATGAAR